MTIAVHHGDCLDVLATLPRESFDAVICDPPYHLTSITKRFGGANAAPAKFGSDGVFQRSSAGFMNMNWDGGDVAFRAETWRLVYDVLKPGAHMLVFGGTRTVHRMACAIEDAGFELRDTLCWLYGSGFPHSHDVSRGIDRTLGAERERVKPRSIIAHQRNIGNTRPYMSDPDHTTVSDVPVTPEAVQWVGWGTALKPSREDILLCRKPLGAKTVADNVLRYGTSALNIDACRVTPTGEALHGGGSTIGKKIENHHEGWQRPWMNDPVARGEMRQRSADSQVKAEALGRWPPNTLTDGSDEVLDVFAGYGKSTPARFFYSAKASKNDRAGSQHPTVKPLKLLHYLCRLITPPGGQILDPFAGSGTTGQAAREEGFSATLIERHGPYVVDIMRRLQRQDP